MRTLPFAAGRALAARLVLREGQVELGDVDHAVILVEDDHAAAAHDRAGLGQGVEIDGDVDPLGRDAAAGRAAGLDGLELLAVGHAAADVEDDLAERGAHRHFDQPVWRILPARAKTLVPPLFSVPTRLYHSAP